MVIKELYILPVRFSADELQTLRTYISADLHDVFSVTHEVSCKTEVILTKLVQRTRLERELRSLHLSSVVLILQCSLDWSRMSDAYKAWGVYAPCPRQSGELRGNSRSMYATLEPHHLVKRDLRIVPGVHLEATRDTARDIETGRGIQREIVSGPLPSLLRHESTTDPSSMNHITNATKCKALSNEKYSCQRWAPLLCPNEPLVSQFQLMKLARTLQGDAIGERAYSTAIASIRSLDKVVHSAADVERLEGCGKKVIEMTSEWLKTGHISEIEIIWDQPELKVLLTFWNCHGVGAFTARDWFYNKGYRDLNDAIQDWDNLSRPIQIGLKHYEDFLIPIPREEVAYIGKEVAAAAHAVLRKYHASGNISYEICGGFRRGKEESGDVDIVLTHENCHDFDNMLEPLITELEGRNIIRTVISSHHERDITKQDKSGISIALVVIVLPEPFGKTYRRLDIIVSPPRSYITAITGWSGSTTLERDLRRYANDIKGWTFDSTGISDMIHRTRIEDDSFMWAAGDSVVQLEKNLFTFLGLEWIPPTFRNAG